MSGETDQWEYLVIEFGPHSSVAVLNGFGRSGWELVAVAVQFTSHFCYFKRRKAPSG